MEIYLFITIKHKGLSMDSANKPAKNTFCGLYNTRYITEGSESGTRMGCYS